MKKSKKKVLVIILILLIIIAGVLLYLKISKGEEINNPLVELLDEEPKEEINIYKGTDRPIAVMIDNVRSSKTTSRIKRCIYGL